MLAELLPNKARGQRQNDALLWVTDPRVIAGPAVILSVKMKLFDIWF